MATVRFSMSSIILLAMTLVVTMGCSRSSTTLRRGPSNVPTIPNDYTIFDNIGDQPQTCSSISGTLTRVSPLGAVEVGQDVVFEINVLNCSKYRVERLDGAVGGTFNQSKIWYTKRYTTTYTNVQEGIRIIGIDSEGGSVAPITVLANSFPVDPAGSSAPIACSASPVVPVINLEVDVNGVPLSPPPAIGFNVTSNRDAKVINVANYAGAIFPSTTLPTAGAKYQNVAVVIANLYQNMLEFEIQDAANASKTAKCSANVYIRPIVKVPAPTCTITPSKTAAYIGEEVTFTFSASGHFQSGSMNNGSVQNGAQIKLPINGQTTVSGTVTGPGGVGTCSATVQAMAALVPVTIGFNFEDATDADYNDAVTCTSGFFKIDRDYAVSLKHQTVRVSTRQNSAYNHTVHVFVVRNGVMIWENSAASSQRLSFDVPLAEGDVLVTGFASHRGPRTNQGFHPGSDWVRLGHYCN